jgi:hypothetical protein
MTRIGRPMGQEDCDLATLAKGRKLAAKVAATMVRRRVIFCFLPRECRSIAVGIRTKVQANCSGSVVSG